MKLLILLVVNYQMIGCLHCECCLDEA